MKSVTKVAQEDPQIVEIAQLADVALSTALRVLGGKSNVSAATAKRVLDAHRQLSGGTSQHYAISSSRRKKIVQPAIGIAKQSDVARIANVGLATVSRALRGDGFVSKEKLERILTAARELNYVPNRAAQTLRGSDAGMVGLIIPSFEEPFMRFVETIEGVVSLQGALLTLTCSHSSEPNILKLARDLSVRKADGFVLVHPTPLGSELIKELRQCIVPIVWVNAVSSIYLNPSEGLEQESSVSSWTELVNGEALMHVSPKQEEPGLPSQAAAVLANVLRSRAFPDR